MPPTPDRRTRSPRTRGRSPGETPPTSAPSGTTTTTTTTTTRSSSSSRGAHGSRRRRSRGSSRTGSSSRKTYLLAHHQPGSTQAQAQAQADQQQQQQQQQAQQQVQEHSRQFLGSSDLVELPRFLLTLSRAEKDEDFAKIKGTKLPQRPKERAKAVEKCVHVSLPACCPSRGSPPLPQSACLLC